MAVTLLSVMYSRGCRACVYRGSMNYGFRHRLELSYGRLMSLLSGFVPLSFLLFGFHAAGPIKCIKTVRPAADVAKLRKINTNE